MQQHPPWHAETAPAVSQSDAFTAATEPTWESERTIGASTPNRASANVPEESPIEVVRSSTSGLYTRTG